LNSVLNTSTRCSATKKTGGKDGGKDSDDEEDPEKARLQAGLEVCFRNSKGSITNLLVSIQKGAILREKPNVKWTDVAGLLTAKASLQEV